MAIEVPEGVQGLFLVLTGEQWPTANEDALWEVGNAWGTAGDRLQNELAPYLIQVVQHIRENFTGKSAIKFAQMMAPYASSPPHLLPQAATQFQQLKKFLQDAAAQVEYTKIISFEEVALLIAQIAWAIAMSFFTDGASMTWLAGRMAIVRFLLKTIWGRLLLQLIISEVFGIAFQVALDVLTQLIQMYGTHHRTEWDKNSTLSAVEVGAVGGALSLPLSAISHSIAHGLTKILTKVLSRDINVAVLRPAVVRAVNGAVRNAENKPIATVAKDITNGLIKAADKPLRIRLIEIGVPALVEMIEEGLHEVVTEGVVMAANGQGFQFNPYSFTSGVAGNIAGKIGHGLGSKVQSLRNPAGKGYAPLGDGTDVPGKGELEPLLTSGHDVSDTASIASGSSGSSGFSDSGSVTNPFADHLTSGDEKPLPLQPPLSPTPATNPTSTSAFSSTPSHGANQNVGTPTTGTPSQATNGSGRTTPVESSPGTSVRGPDGTTTRSETPPPVSPKPGTNGTSPTSTPGSVNNGTKTTAETAAPTSGRGVGGPNTGPSITENTGNQATATSGSGSRSLTNGDGTSQTQSSTTMPSQPGRTNPGPDGSGTTTQATSGTNDTRPATAGQSTSTGLGKDTTSTTSTPATDGANPTTPTGAGEPNAGAKTNLANQGPQVAPATKPPGENSTTTGRPVDNNPYTNGTYERVVAESRASAPQTALPEHLTKNATTVPATDLATVKRESVTAERVVVAGSAPAKDVQAAARRLGVDVVARVDRSQLGSGRRQGVQWMRFTPDGRRPQPAITTPGPIKVPAMPAPLGERQIAEHFPWLRKINPLATQGGDFLTNCMFSAIGVDLSLEEIRLNPGEDRALLHYYQVPPEAHSPYEHLLNLGKGDPVDVPGYQAIAEALTAAGPGARGMVLVTTHGTEIGHVFNVVNDGGQVVFLDGQKGTQANLRGDFRSLQFLPTSENFPREVIEANAAPSEHARFFGSDPGHGDVGRNSGDNGGDSGSESGRTPFSGPGRTLGEAPKAVVPGLGQQANDALVAERIARLNEAGGNGSPQPAKAPRSSEEKAGKGYRGDPMTVNDLPDGETGPFQGQGRTLDESGTGGAKPPEWAADRAKRLKAADDAAAVREQGPFSGTGHQLGESDGKGAGIKGIDNEVRRRSAAERAAMENASPGAQQRPATPTSRQERRTGKGFDEGPMTIADLPEGDTASTIGSVTRPEGLDKGSGANPMTINDPPTGTPAVQENQPFTGEGLRLGTGSGNGDGIPGLDNATRERAAAERAKLRAEGKLPAESTAKSTPARKITTLQDLKKPGETDGNSDSSSVSSDSHEYLQTRGGGSTTLLEKPRPGESSTSKETDQEPATFEETTPPPTERSGENPAERLGENPAEQVTKQATEASERSTGRTRAKPTERPSKPSAAKSGKQSTQKSDKPVTKKSATTVGDETTTARTSVPEPVTTSETSVPASEPESSSVPSRADLGHARTTLAALAPERRAQVMDQARAIIGDLTGEPPAGEDTGGLLSLPNRNTVLVAAEISRSGSQAGDRLAHQLTHDPMGELLSTYTPRVVLDQNRLDTVRSTLEQLSDTEYAQVLQDAREIIYTLTGVDPGRDSGPLSQEQTALLVTAAEIQWAGHGRAAVLAADVLGAPRPPRSGPVYEHLSGLADEGRRDLRLAGATLRMRYHVTTEGALATADAILSDLSTPSPTARPGVRTPEQRRTLVAAEILRRGEQAGRRLAGRLVNEDGVAKTSEPYPKPPEKAAEETVTQISAMEAAAKGTLEPEKKSGEETVAKGGMKEPESTPPPKPKEKKVHWEEDKSDNEDWAEHTKQNEKSPEPPPKQTEDTGQKQPENQAQQQQPQTPSSSSKTPPPEQIRVEDVLAQTEVHWHDNRPVGIWLPGSPPDGPRPDQATITRLGRILPEGTVFVFGTAHDGRIMAGGKEISADVMAEAIRTHAPGHTPILLIDGGASVAEQLSGKLSELVVATPHKAVYDPETGEVHSKGSGSASTDSSSESLPEDWFRVFQPDDTEGEPVFEGLEPPEESPDQNEQTVLPPPDPPIHVSTVARPDLSPMIRSIGVPRAGLPQMADLIGQIRTQLTAAGVQYSENEMNLLPHRLLANYPYLLGDNSADGTSGLQVPFGNGELLITLDPTQPHTVTNPAGSTMVPSNVPPEGEHHAVDTINATYATGAHTQSFGGQTGATRGALALSFGFGLTPFVASVAKVGVSISGAANQSNRSTTHIADAEGGHVEDNRTEATLVSYTPNWSFKVRTDPNQSWQNTPVNQVNSASPEKLLLWVPGHYLEATPEGQITAAGDDVKANRMPDFHFASGLTNIPRLFDQVVRTLGRHGLELPMGSSIRGELLQKLSNLNAHLDEAVNLNGGYRITLHNEYGRPVATVAVHTEVRQAVRLGNTSNLAHIENVRTAIDGSSGGHSVTNSSTVGASGELDLLPSPIDLPKLGFGISTSLSYTSSTADAISAGRVGLNVVVPRNTSNTVAYDFTFRHHATVSVRNDTQPTLTHRAGNVDGRGLVRMPEAAAFEHGYSVDREALKQPPAHGDTVAFTQGAIRDTGRRQGDPDTKETPQYVREGKGVGMGLVMVPQTTVDLLQAQIKQRLREKGFLPANDDAPFQGTTWYGHGNKVDSQIDNLELLEKMVSQRGLDSHYDQIRQDGMTFTLRKRRGGMGIDFDVDSAKVTITARQSAGRPPRFLRSTKEFHTVNLAMGMDTAGMTTSHSRKLAWGLKFKTLFTTLKAGVMGFELQRTVGASDSVSFLNNRPELLEYPGVVDEFALTSDYHITIEYQHSGQTGKIAKGRRDQGVGLADGIVVRNQTALTYLLPLGTENGPVSADPTPANVLDQGVVYFLDTTGVKAAGSRALRDLIGPAGTGDQEVSTYTSTIEMRSHLKEILNHQYTTDRPFSPGIFRDTFGAMDIRGTMGRSQFTGATNDKFVLGVIKLWLAENRTADTSSSGVTWEQLDLAVGGDSGKTHLTGEMDVNRNWTHNRNEGMGHSGGKELIQLDFNRVYAYQTTVDFTVRSRQEKHSKALWSSTRNQAPQVQNKTMVYLLPEPEALTKYAEGILPVSDAQLGDAMNRWQNGELKLSGDVAAKILMRWTNEAPLVQDDPRAGSVDALQQLHASGASPIREGTTRDQFNTQFTRQLRAPEDPYLLPRPPEDLQKYVSGEATLTNARLAEVLTAWQGGELRLSGDMVASTLLRWRQDVPEPPNDVTVDRSQLVAGLAEMHTGGGSPIRSVDIRARFNAAFGTNLEESRVPYQHMEMPEYLTRTDPNGRFLGHTGIHDLEYDNGRSTYDLVKAEIDRVAPGLLAAGAEIWDGRGRRIGTMQGGIDALQAIFGRGRDQAMWEDLLADGGYSIYLVHPMGWLVSDVVEVNLGDVLTSQPEVHDFKPETGLENYGHAYVGTSKGKSRDGSQAFTFAKFAAGNDNAGGPVDLKVADGHHRGTNRAENAVSEQTVYDWGGHYRVRMRHELTVTVRRLKMQGRPLNNFLISGFKSWTNAVGNPARNTVQGTLNLQVPHALAEAGQIRGPAPLRNLQPLPKLPGNAYVTGAMLDHALPAATKLLQKVFSPNAFKRALGFRVDDPNARSSLSLSVLMSRTHMTNHIREATGGDRYKLAENITLPGHSNWRATMWMSGDLYDAQVVGRMKGAETGTGRYIKHQSGTSVNNSTDVPRVVGDYSFDGSNSINPAPKPPEGSPEAKQPHTPDKSWDLHTEGGRTTSLNQNSSGTENYRREQHAKELGQTLLIRMRGQFFIEAKKTSHHLLWKTTTSDTTHRSEPFTGDVYVEMFEAQWHEFQGQIAANAATAQARLRNRVDTRQWNQMILSQNFRLGGMLSNASHRVDGFHAYQDLVRQARREYDGSGRLRLSYNVADIQTRRYRAMLDWAVKTMQTDLAAAQKADPNVTAPPSLERYEGYRARSGMPALTQPVEAEIQQMIREVNALHDLNPGNPLHAPAQLPAAESLFNLDPTYLARDLAHELNAHVRLDIRQPDGTVRNVWADPGGRIYAFDPATFDGTMLTADQATQVGLWSPEVRRDAVDHGLTPQELGTLYNTSWTHQQTFEQAVSAETRRLRERMAAAHPDLPDLFDRARQARDDWRAEVTRIERARAQLATDTTITQNQRDETNALLTQQHNEATEQRDFAEEVVEDLRATARVDPAAVQTALDDATLQTVHRTVTDLEMPAEGNRIRQAYRQPMGATLNEAIGNLTGQLQTAGSGALSLVVTQTPNGTGARYTVVNDDGQIKWFEPTTWLPINPPTDITRMYSLDLGPDGRLLTPPDALTRGPGDNRSYPQLHNRAMSDLAGRLDRQPTPPLWTNRPRQALVRSTDAFESATTGAGATVPPVITNVSVVDPNQLPAHPHIYQHQDGRHGIGPAGTVSPNWQHLGSLSEYLPIHWLTQHGPAQVPTAADVVRTGLSGAVQYLAGDPGGSNQDRVHQAFSETGRKVLTMDRLPVGLSVGSWVWFRGPDGTGAAVRTPTGYRVMRSGQPDTTVLTTRQLREEFQGGQHTLVIAVAPKSKISVDPGKSTSGEGPSTSGKGPKGPKPTDQTKTTETKTDQTDGTKTDGTKTEQTNTEQTKTDQTKSTETKSTDQTKSADNSTVTSTAEKTGKGGRPPLFRTATNVDTPVSHDSHLYVDENSGSHRYDAPGLSRPGLRDLGPVSMYTPIAWLLADGRAGGMTVQQVLEHQRNQVESFLTEATVLGEPGEAARSLLATTGRVIELTDSLPQTLPAGTMIYYVGNGISGAAVVLNDGRYRRITPSGATLLSTDHNLANLAPGADTFVIARPLGWQQSSTVDEVQVAAGQASQIEFAAFDQAALDRALQRRGLVPINVPVDGDCFYHSLIVIAGSYLAQHIPGLNPGSPNAIQTLRTWLANRLRADFAVAMRGLPSRYADYFHVQDGGPTLQQQQDAFVRQIETMGSWSNEAGDLVAQIAAHELGLPMTLIQDRYVRNLGPDGRHRIDFIRTPGHFRGARPTGRNAQRFPWHSYRPIRESTVQAAQTLFQEQVAAAQAELRQVQATFAQTQHGLPNNVANERAGRYQTHLALFHQGQDGIGYEQVYPHVRAQQRLNDMLQAVGEIRDMNTEIRTQIQQQDGSTLLSSSHTSTSAALSSNTSTSLPPPSIHTVFEPQSHSASPHDDQYGATQDAGGVRPMPHVQPPTGLSTGDARHTFVRPATELFAPHQYEITNTGHIRLPGGQELSPGSWVEYQGDYVHLDTGMRLRGGDGRIEPIHGWAGIRVGLDEETTTPQEIWADATHIYLRPRGGGPIVGLPLSTVPGGLAQSIYEALSSLSETTAPKFDPANDDS